MVSIEIEASCEAVFGVVHDYGRRLEWDTMLSKAILLDGAEEAGLGVRSLCVGTWQGLYLGLETEYIRYEMGKVTAVKLTNRPLFFDQFAATMRHTSLEGNRSRLTYIYAFQARPALLAPLLEPMMNLFLLREVHNRLHALKAYVEGV